MNFVATRQHLFSLNQSLTGLLQRKHPEQLLLGAFWLSLILTLSYHLSTRELGIVQMLGESLLLGFSYGCLAFFNHELMHGTMVRSKRLSKVLAYPGFFIFGLSAELWDTAHNQLHHFHTNKHGVDPDTSPTFDRILSHPVGKAVTKYLPGSGKLVSYLFFVSAFTIQAINIMWYKSLLDKTQTHLYRKMNRTRAILETLSYYAIGVFLALTLSPLKLIFVLIVPKMIANFCVTTYVTVLHPIRPLNHENEPLKTGLSVRSHPIIDFLFFNFGYHNEHHVFPEMNQRYFPRIQEILKNEFKNDYVHLDHSTVLKLAMATPRIYLNDSTVIDPGSGFTVNLHALKEANFKIPDRRKEPKIIPSLERNPVAVKSNTPTNKPDKGSASPSTDLAQL